MQPKTLEIVIKWSVICSLVSLISLCTYSRINEIQNKKLKRIPTPENISRWEKIKKYQLEAKVCESMDMAVEIAKKNNFICIDNFETIVSRDKNILDKYMPDYFDFYDIPDGYRSVSDIPVSIDSLQCNNAEERIRNWKSCPTGYIYKN
jgi:hypothetical protein